MIGGLPGSGKSTMAKFLSTGLNFTVLDKDTIANPMTERMLEISGRSNDDRESDFYLNNIRDVEYKTMMDIAFENISLGVDVVCCAPFGKEFKSEEWINAVTEKVLSLNAVVSFIVLKSDLVTIHKRILLRKETRDTWKLNNWSEYIESAVSGELDYSKKLKIVENNKEPMCVSVQFINIANKM